MLKISPSCTLCSKCVKVCPANIIEIKDNSPILTSNHCITCGHCEAICPENALKNTLVNEETLVEINNHPVLDPKTAELFLRSRRSIRCFKEASVTEEETKKLVNIGRYAQTAKNSQGVSYIVVSSKEKVEALKQLTIDFFKNHQDPAFQQMYKYFSSSNKDIIFRGAPMCILALTENGADFGKDNARFSLTYIELFAPTLGLGTCWAGYFEIYTSTNCEKLRNLLEIPQNLEITGALLYGYPKYSYKRLVSREPLKVNFV